MLPRHVVAEVLDAFDLGDGTLSPEPVAYGRVGEIWRLEATTGSWAVKTERNEVSEEEQAPSVRFHEGAVAAGIRAPGIRRTREGRVVAAVVGPRIRVLEWVDMAATDGDRPRGGRATVADLSDAGGPVVGGGRPAGDAGPLVPGADRRFGVGRPARGAVPGRAPFARHWWAATSWWRSGGCWLLPETSVVSPRPVREQRAERPGRRARRLRLRQQPRALRPGVGGWPSRSWSTPRPSDRSTPASTSSARGRYDAYRDGGRPARRCVTRPTSR